MFDIEVIRCVGVKEVLINTNAKVIFCNDPSLKGSNTLICNRNKLLFKDLKTEYDYIDGILKIEAFSLLENDNNALIITTNDMIDKLSIRGTGFKSNIVIENVAINKIQLANKMSNIILNNIRCNDLVIEANNGLVDINDSKIAESSIYKSNEKEVGKIKINGIESEKLDIKSNCKIDIKNIKTNELDIRAKHKEINVDNISADSIRIITLTAKTNISKVTSENINIESYEHGDVDIKKCVDDVKTNHIRIYNGDGEIKMSEVKTKNLSIPNEKKQLVFNNVEIEETTNKYVRELSM